MHNIDRINRRLNKLAVIRMIILGKPLQKIQIEQHMRYFAAFQGMGIKFCALRQPHLCPE